MDTATEAAATLDLSGETQGKAAQVADGFWIIATTHRPGGAQTFPPINNRSIVLRVTDEGTPVLAVFNATDGEQAFAEVHRIERETGLTVRYVISVGGGHHFLMPPWHDEFPEAQLLVGPVRVPRTAGGSKMMELPRVSAMSLEDPLPQLSGELDVLLFDGLRGGVDVPAPAEGGKDGFVAMAGGMVRMMAAKDPYDELWLYHRATRTVIGGENLGWYYPADELAKQPFMIRGMITPDRVWVQAMGRKILDEGKVHAHWKRVLSWPARNVLTYHDVATSGFVDGDGQAALREAVAAVKQLPT